MLLRHDAFNRLCQARDLLAETPEQPLSIKAVAREVRISPFHFIRQFEVPSRLRDVEVPQSQLSSIADTVLHEVNRSHTVDREVTLEDLNRLLEALPQ